MNYFSLKNELFFFFTCASLTIGKDGAVVALQDLQISIKIVCVPIKKPENTLSGYYGLAYH
jgi:hypothetical protein